MRKLSCVPAIHTIGMLGLLLTLVGCSASITPTSQPVEVTIKVTANGKPVKNVSMTLQPLVGGGQAVGEVVNGQLVTSVVPGTYTYYIDQAKQAADLKVIPEAYRVGSLDRRLDIKEAGTYEVSMN